MMELFAGILLFGLPLWLAIVLRIIVKVFKITSVFD